MSARRRGQASVRRILLLVSAGAALYVAALGVFVLLAIEPAARALQARAGILAAEYDSLRTHAATIEEVFGEATRLARQPRLSSGQRDEVGALRARATVVAAQSAGVQASLTLSAIPTAMRISLAEAAELETQAAGVLLEALTDLDAGHPNSAAAWLSQAEANADSLSRRLGDAQRLGLSDLAERERVLGGRAGSVGVGAVVWVVLGAALVGLGLLVLHRLMYVPLAVLDRGLARVAAGDLDASLPVRRDDELGRLTAHFNEMTAVLRAHPEVEALHRERSLVETLMEHVPDSIYFKDREGRFLRINRALADRAGLADPADAVGKTDVDFFAPDHAEAARKVEEEILRTGRPVLNLEELETWRDGRSAWVSTTKMPLHDKEGSIVGTFGVSRDITERREAERHSRESEARFRTAFMTGTDAYIIVGRDDGLMVEANDQFLAMYGYRRDEVIGRTSLELGLWVHPEERQRLLTLLAAEGYVRNFEVVGRKKDGVTFPVLYSMSQLPGDGPPLLMGVIRDISQERKAAAALHNLEEQFRQAQRLEAVGRLAGGVAHDFNNILTAITGYTQLLLDEFRPNDPRRADLEEILAAARRAAALTRQLLAFSRKQVLQPRVIDLNDVVRGVEKMLRRLIGEDVELTFTAGEGLLPVRADPGQLEQVILNLAVNARDAMPHGGRLTIETANVVLDASYADARPGVATGPCALLAVSDTGTGMDAETLSHIFEPFFTTKEQGKGTGLGLATVHGIVTQSGGSVAVYSELGHGTSFKVYFPAAPAARETVDAVPAAAGGTGGHETVLVVEDDRAVREVVAEALTQRGYRVLRAASGEEAMRVAGDPGADVQLLLTDIVMPGIRGRELAQVFRETHPEVRLLYMSGYTDDAVIRHGILEEGTPFLQKPFTVEALALKVREVLGTRD